MGHAGCASINRLVTFGRYTQRRDVLNGAALQWRAKMICNSQMQKLSSRALGDFGNPQQNVPVASTRSVADDENRRIRRHRALRASDASRTVSRHRHQLFVTMLPLLPHRPQSHLTCRVSAAVATTRNNSCSQSPSNNSRPRSQPAFQFFHKRRPLDPVDKEKLDSENEPVSAEAAAVEYVRNSTRQFFVNRASRHCRGGTLYRQGDTLTVHEKVISKTWRARFVDRLKRLAFPEGYPQSVGPGFVEYTKWRLSAFFWGGAIGVFSTQGLLLAVGVGRQSAAPLAAALQWVIRDGMGRAGRMLFSQVGNGFDAETKQYRLMAALVLNLSCALESVTPAIPQLFLPLACVANMAKGASTVAAASTRSAIYRSFMRIENLGDITAKQETVGVVGDLMGTAVGILLSRATAGSRELSTAIFLSVSAAHMFSAYREIKGIQLSSLNRQRAHMLIKYYLEEGRVPNLRLGNRNERIVNRPWLDSLHAPNIDLGARLQECAPDAEALQYLLRLYKNERYLFTYENARMKIVLRNDAKSRDCLKAFLQADYFWNRYKQEGVRESRNRDLVEEAYKFANSKFDSFAREARLNGWLTDSVLLRPIGRRASWNNSASSLRR